MRLLGQGLQHLPLDVRQKSLDTESWRVENLNTWKFFDSLKPCCSPEAVWAHLYPLEGLN